MKFRSPNTSEVSIISEISQIHCYRNFQFPRNFQGILYFHSAMQQKLCECGTRDATCANKIPISIYFWSFDHFRKCRRFVAFETFNFDETSKEYSTFTLLFSKNRARVAHVTQHALIKFRSPNTSEVSIISEMSQIHCFWNFQFQRNLQGILHFHSTIQRK